MQVFTKRALREFGLRYPDAVQEILDWFEATEAADWANGAAVRTFDRTADLRGRRPLGVQPARQPLPASGSHF